VTPRHRTIAVVASATALVFVLFPGVAGAQRAVPRGGGAPQTRHAVPRPVPARPIGPGGVYRGPSAYRPYYASPYYWYGGYYGGYYSYPFYFSVGVGGYPYYYGYPYYQYPFYPYYGYAYDPTAHLRLQVTPRVAEVFVDGSYAGTVDDFDGSFQRLNVYPGEHELEIYLAGHRSLQQRIYLQPGKTFNVRHAMEPLGPGELEPVRPSGGPRPDASRVPQALPPTRPDDEGFEGQPPLGVQSEFGALALRVQPGDASVTIDGNTWEASAQSGRLIVQLGAGVHTLEIRKDNYRTYITDITVRPGETTTLNVAMTPD